MSFRHKKVISTMDRKPLNFLGHKGVSLLFKSIIEDGDGHELFTVNEHWSWSIKFTCTVPSINGPTPLLIRRERLLTSAEIKLDEDANHRTVATIERECLGSAEGPKKNRQTYYITVAPGVDLSLALILCLAFDDLKWTKSR